MARNTAERRGEDGGWGELMDLADSLPGRAVDEVRDDVIIFTRMDFDGTTWRGIAPRRDPNAPADAPLPPVQWEVIQVGDYWASRGVKLGPTEVGPYEAPEPFVPVSGPRR